MPSNKYARIALWLALSLAVYGLLLGLVAPYFLRGVAASKVGEALGRPVDIAELHIQPYSLSVTVKGLRIGEAQGSEAAASVAEIYANLAASSLWHFAPVLEELRIAAPQLRIERIEGARFNWSDVLERLAARPSEGGEAHFALHNISIAEGGVLFLDDEKKSRHELSSLELGIPFISNLAADVATYVEPKLAFKLDGSAFALNGRARPFAETREAGLDIDLQNLDLADYWQYVPLPLKFRVARALLDSRLAVRFAQPPGKPPGVSLSGKFALRNLSVVGPQERELAGFEKLEVAISEFDPIGRRLGIESIDLDSMRADVVRDATGKLELLDMLPPATKDATPAVAAKDAPAPAKPVPPAPAWQIGLKSFKASGGRVKWTDHSVAPAAVLEIQDISLGVQDYASSGNEPVKLSFEAGLPGGAKIREQGAAVLPERSLQGRLELAGFDLKNIAPYVKAAMPLDLEGGSVSAGVDFHARYAGDAPELVLKQSSVALQRLKTRVDGQPFAEFASFAVDGLDLDLAQRKVAIGKLETREGKIALRRVKDGMLLPLPAASPVSATPAAGTRPAKLAAAAAPAAPAWEAAVERLVVADWGVKLRDETVGLDYAIDAIAAEGEKLSTAPGAQSRVSLKFRQGAKGNFSATGSVSLQPLKADLALELRALDVAPLASYARARLNTDLRRASLDVRGKLALAQDKDGNLRGNFRGDTGLNRLLARDAINDTDLLRWESLFVKGVDIQLLPLAISVGEVALSDFYARAIVTKEGKLNLTQIVKQESEAPTALAPAPPAPGQAKAADAPAPAPAPAATTASTPAAPAIPIRIGKISLQGGSVNFSDFFIKPEYSARLTRLAGVVTGMDSNSAEPADLDVRGAVEDSAPLEISGKLNVLGPVLFLDVKASASGIELAPLSAYSTKYVGYGIEKGKLSMNVAYRVENGKLDAKNNVVLDQLTFGPKVESPSALKLPVLLAVSLLKDSRGVIDVNLPISGSLDDPQFSIGAIVGKVIGNLIVKAVTAPFRLLGAIFGGGADLGHVAFDPGSARINVAAAKQLASLAKALNDRPALKLEITGRIDPEGDRDGAKREALRAKMLALKRGDSKDDEAGEGGDISPEEYATLLKKVYGNEKMPKPRNLIGFAKDLPAAEMEKLILANIAINDEDLNELGLKRAQAVKKWLANDGKVPQERMFVLATKPVASQAAEPAAAAGTDAGGVGEGGAMGKPAANGGSEQGSLGVDFSLK
ncbi:MAG: DUF748 domain-containing protein [Rhodocyclaceae bacterium]|nr:DUF748 domain-containing protein [Rhodocyclaceae bacterium]